LKSSKKRRPDWDEYFLDLVDQIATRATCDRGKSGCVIVKDKRILCTGYVGSPSGLPHCDDVGHLLKKVVDEDGVIRQHCTRTIHAEQNAICQAAKHGIELDGTTLYCSMEPCRVCAMLIISSGIKKVVTGKRYHAGHEARELFRDAGVDLIVKEDTVETYKNQ
jgi:dCMP deaminase